MERRDLWCFSGGAFDRIPSSNRRRYAFNHRRVGSILLIGWLWALAVVPHVTFAGWQIASARLTRRRG